MQGRMVGRVRAWGRILVGSCVALIATQGVGRTAPPEAPPQSKTANAATPMQRADELLRQMTVEEKAMQLSSVFPVGLFGPDGPIHGQLDAQLKNGIGHVAALGLIGHKTPEQIAKSVNAVQRYLVTQTRLKIPAIFHNEAMSGVVAPHFTQFPTSIGLAATWDPTATQEMADIIRRQMRAVGQLQALSPVLDVARDARWGRVSETYGEDPYLVSVLSVAYTRGLQGQDLTQGVLATAKHFVGYGVTEGGQNMAATASARASSTTSMPVSSRPHFGSPGSRR
jgi:beta-xylosidase